MMRLQINSFTLVRCFLLSQLVVLAALAFEDTLALSRQASDSAQPNDSSFTSLILTVQAISALPEQDKSKLGELLFEAARTQDGSIAVEFLARQAEIGNVDDFERALGFSKSAGPVPTIGTPLQLILDPIIQALHPYCNEYECRKQMDANALHAANEICWTLHKNRNHKDYHACVTNMLTLYLATGRSYCWYITYPGARCPYQW